MQHHIYISEGIWSAFHSQHGFFLLFLDWPDTFKEPPKNPYYKYARGVVSFETCCQWVLLLSVQIITLPVTFTVQKYILSLCSVLAGCFRVSIIHQTLTWTIGFLTCVHDHSYACVSTHGRLDIPIVSAQHFWLRKTHSLTGFELGSLNVECSTSWVTPSRPIFCSKFDFPWFQRNLWKVPCLSG